MISADLQRRIDRQPRLQIAAYALVAFGVMVIVASFVIGIALGLSTADFFENVKSVRDAAAPDDPATAGILSQQGTIAATTAWMTPFKFLGVASILAGIGTLLYVIVGSLQVRGDAMKAALPVILGVDRD